MDIQVAISAMVRLKCDRKAGPPHLKKSLFGANTTNNFFKGKRRLTRSMKRGQQSGRQRRFNSQGR